MKKFLKIKKIGQNMSCRLQKREKSSDFWTFLTITFDQIMVET